jgi:hypothetical protein
MMLTVRRFVSRIFGSDEVEQQFTVLSPQNTPEWEHHFPQRDRATGPLDATEPAQAEQPRREPSLQAK